MKLTGLDIFDASAERTTEWIHELMRELNWNDHRKAYFALRSVLHGLRDHLPVEQAVRFGNQLPMLIRGFYFEDWDLQVKPLPWHPQQEPLVCAVFRVLERKASEGEIGDLNDSLPADLREFWSSTTRAA